MPTLAEVAARDRFDGRLWLYYVARYTDDDVLRVLVEKADRILCPTERMRAHVLEAAPHTPDKTLTMPPMIPRVEPAELPESGETPRLVYAGTVSRAYRFFETVAMLRRLRRRYPRAELHLAFGKHGTARLHVLFRLRVALVIRLTPGVVNHGPLPREEVHELVRRSHVAISLRDARLEDHQDCLSSKVVEYWATGRPVLLTRMPIYEEILGADYPLFVDDGTDPEPVLSAALSDQGVLRDAATTCLEASRPFGFDSVAGRLAPLVEQAAGAGVHGAS